MDDSICVRQTATHVVCASILSARYADAQTAARVIKENMDKKYGFHWHCIIGEGFGFEITFHTQNLLHVYYQGAVAILLFKC